MYSSSSLNTPIHNKQSFLLLKILSQTPCHLNSIHMMSENLLLHTATLSFNNIIKWKRIFFSQHSLIAE